MKPESSCVKASGQGDNIICLHSCLGSSKQWDGFRERFDRHYRITAPDLIGFGRTPTWDQRRALSLEDEISLLSPVLEKMTTAVHLIGHSYGAALALTVAHRYPDRIASLIVYEPVLVTLLFTGRQQSHAAGEIFLLVAAIRAHYRSGEPFMAVEKFIDYWSGEGSWERFSPDQQQEGIKSPYSQAA